MKSIDDPIDDDFSAIDLIRHPEKLRAHLRHLYQLHNLDVIDERGVTHHIKRSPKSLNAILDLRTKSSGIPSPGNCPKPGAPVTEIDGPTQWHPFVLTTTVWTHSVGSVSWSISHVAPNYTDIGNFSITRNGVVIATYAGGVLPGEPYQVVQSGSSPASSGDVFTSEAGPHSFTVPVCPGVSTSFTTPGTQTPEEADCEACINSILVDDVTGDVLTDDITKNVLQNT